MADAGAGVRDPRDPARRRPDAQQRRHHPRQRRAAAGRQLLQRRPAARTRRFRGHAVVRRIWPDRLAVTLEEHRPAALWVGEDGNDRLVNAQGEVFEANVGDVEDDALPSFAGPEGSAQAMLAMYRQLQPLLQRQQIDIDRLHLSGRGSWRVEVDNGAVVELGRGGADEVAARTERFVRTLPQVTGRFRQPLLSADLRHTDGYAVRLRDVTTSAPPATGKKIN
jgi:cell division protein FtsQ